MTVAKLRTERLPPFRYAFYFDGVDDYMIVLHNDTLNLTTLTLAFWSFEVVNVGWTVVGKQATTTYREAYGITFRWDSENYKITDQNDSLVLIFYRIQLLKPTFLAMTFDGSTLKGYANDMFVGSKASNPPQQNTRDFYIGRWWSSAQSLRGYIHAVYLYSRVLSDSEIVKLYNGKVPTDGIIMLLEAHPDNVKDVDGDGINEWIDKSGYGNHAKIYGATLKDLYELERPAQPPLRLAPALR